MSREGSARRVSARPGLAVAATLAATAALVLGVSYTLPTVTFKVITSKQAEVYSIWGGIASLWKDGNTILAPIVFLFSIVFPVAKLLLLGWVLLRERAADLHRAEDAARGAERRRLVRWLRLAGKWSMLDVLIVGLFVGSIRIGIATASSQPGIHVFAAAVVLSMIAAAALERGLERRRLAELQREGQRAPDSVAPSGGSAAPGHHQAYLVQRVLRHKLFGRCVSVCAVLGVAAVLREPLLVVSKGFFFSNEVHLWSTSRALAAEDERVLGLGFMVFVVVVPALRCAASLAIRWLRRPPVWLVRSALVLDEWGLLDVAALAFAIVHVKLDELATTRLSLGFWAVIAAGALSMLDAWSLRRAHFRDGHATNGTRAVDADLGPVQAPAR
ncbi:MAG: paraquat-inducible protein A [Planctomycetota bacterium]